jgi:hypothetical protein
VGEILGLGLSHYPGVAVPPEFQRNMLRGYVNNGRIPPEVYEDKARWPAAMRAEWGADEGLAASYAHHARLVAGYRKLREALDAFAPDLVLIFGDDQYENFQNDCIPAFCVYIFKEHTAKPFAGRGGGGGLYGTTRNAWGLPPETEVRLRGHREAANALARALLAQDFDAAYAYTTRAERGLAHSFLNTILYLDYDRRGFDYPIVPFHVNCYGNQIVWAARSQGEHALPARTPPSPSPRRCFAIGRATARFFAASPWRVAIVGSSSWSHGSLTAKHDRLYPDVEADRARHEELRSGRFVEWGRLDIRAIEESGQHEVLNWVCLAGAMSELGQTAEIVDFVETYIFNSSKCFALFPPAGVAQRTAPK